MSINHAATAQLNGHAAVAANPDPPKHQRHRILRSLTLNVSTLDRLDLWQTVADSEGQTVIPVNRKLLVHLLLDHATLVARLAALINVTEPHRTT